MPGFLENERVQEWLLMASDRVSTLNKRWWYALGISLIAVLPLFFILKYSLATLFIRSYDPPVVNTDRPLPVPLTILDRMIFDLGGSTYSGLVRIKNINLDRGVPELSYAVSYKTAGASIVSKISGKTFVLPASEKILVFSRFTSEQKPELVEFTYNDPKFLYKPQLPAANLEVQRVQLESQNGEFVVVASIKNLSPFTLKQIYLPVVLYNRSNKIVGVNSTVVNLVKSQELRTFRFVWPSEVKGVVRAEINPEVNIFDPGLLITETGSIELFEATGGE